MNVCLPQPGRYLVAVSGGLDSVCLLDILAAPKKYDLVVAHFDHGIREDSYIDHDLVASLADSYGLKFISAKGELGNSTSEAVAREARYDFLFRAKRQFAVDAVITAHHLDDRLETLIINLIRGTGRKGLASIGQSSGLIRPLLKVTRSELKDYGFARKLVWRDDPSNKDEKYLRNYIRMNVLPRLSPKDKNNLTKLMDRQAEINAQIDQLISGLLNREDIKKLSLSTLKSLPFNASKELVATWLRDNNLINFNRKTIERVVIAAKTQRPGRQINVYGKARINVEKTNLALVNLER